MAGQVETGTSSPITPSVVNSITAAKKAGAWHEGLVDLQPGDYTCRLRTGGGHIEVCVEAPKPNGQWLSVGGNTDSSTDNVNPNGGMVVAQVRQPAGWVGFIRPTRPLV